MNTINNDQHSVGIYLLYDRHDSKHLVTLYLILTQNYEVGIIMIPIL